MFKNNFPNFTQAVKEERLFCDNHFFQVPTLKL